MVTRLKGMIFGAAMAAAIAAGPAQAGSTSKVFVFRDSLSDTGNLAEIQAVLQNKSEPGANLPDPPFFHDSVSDGAVAVERLAEHYGLRADPSLWATGFNDAKTCSAPASSPALFAVALVGLLAIRRRLPI